ncbi:MAG: dihydropteroate synthase [Tepidisphaeraceae bacterium]
MSPADFKAWLASERRAPLVMGVLNVTPDSFSDGGRFSEPASAIAHARQMIADGADLIDIGGESTRPGSERVPAEEQIRRVVPVIEQLRSLGETLSIDTTRSPVAAAALDAGAHLVNDISAGTDDPGMAALMAKRGCPVVLMHMQGQPATMQDAPAYDDVVDDVRAHLQERLAAFVAAGVDARAILLDPGIGFGKLIHHNLSLLKHLAAFRELGRPLVLGVSRKGFLGRIGAGTGAGSSPADRAWPTAAAVGWCVAQGADIVRVHDVAEMAQVVRVVRAITDAD